MTWKLDVPGMRIKTLFIHITWKFDMRIKSYSYIYRFVSDIGYNGYKIMCQHKALQCAKIEAQLCRVYPPCLLEWRAIQQHCNMSLPVNFADGKTYFVKLYTPIWK